MKTNKIRGLFITHDISNYGASRSLQTLITNYRDINIDLIVRKSLFKRAVNITDIRKRFGSHIENVTCNYLPFDHCYKNKPRNSLKLSVLKLIDRLLWKYHKNKLYDFITMGNYDFIHLNSLVLHPVITPEYQFIIHVREIYDQSNADAVFNLQKAAGVIFIDEATKALFQDVPLPTSIVLNNPFDMTPLRDYADRPFIWPEGDFKDKVVFSIIGNVSAEKGVDFIIRCFMKLKNENARLLIVGQGEKEYTSFCKDLSHHDTRIIFWGDEPDILKIYYVSDYILRGEPYQCIGRTIYEGLYGGCQVIIPAEDTLRKPMFEFETFQHAIHFYKPRNDHELSDLLHRLSLTKVRKLSFYSNVDNYVKQFHKFIETVTHNS